MEGNLGGKGNEARGNWEKDAVLAGTARARAQDKMAGHVDRRSLTDWWGLVSISQWLLACARVPAGKKLLGQALLAICKRFSGSFRLNSQIKSDDFSLLLEKVQSGYKRSEIID